jgi:hypothetical protein
MISMLRLLAAPSIQKKGKAEQKQTSTRKIYFMDAVSL